MALRKIEAMHKEFGTGDNLCKDCCHFQIHMANSRKVFKCECYGVTSSEASDWRKSYRSCGLFNQPYDWIPYIEYLKHSPRKKKDLHYEGQMSLFEGK